MKNINTSFSTVAWDHVLNSRIGSYLNLQKMLPGISARKLICILVTAGCLLAGSVKSQTVCDSLQIDSVQIQPGFMSVYFSNASQHSIIYPVLIVTLNANPYLTVSGNASVASYLDVAGGSNNGVTQFLPTLTQTTPANLVPLNTVFTGTASMYDPNDSSFFCLFQFSFTYGTLTGNAINENNARANTISVYPNPAKEHIEIKMEGLQGQVANITVTNALGEIVLVESAEITGDHGLAESINTEMLEPGIYFVEITSEGTRASSRFIKD